MDLNNIVSTFLMLYFRFTFTLVNCCDPGYFPCNDSLICVEQRFNCDGVNDCSDGSDEQDCEDFHKREYWNNLFRKRPDEDREKKISTECRLKVSIKECSCSIYSLFCEQQQLHHIPFNIPKATQTLDLSGNVLKKLRKASFPILPSLHTLILTSTELERLDEESFANLASLRSLFMSGNKLQIIKDKTFYHNRLINLLVLSHNPIEQLQNQSFLGLSSLSELDLRSCSLSNLQKGVFDPIIKLQTLWLDGNQLEELPVHIFKHLANLQVLSLTKNKIAHISEEIFTGLTSLRSLSMSSNILSELKDDAFGNLSTLLKLDLRSNQISQMEPYVFANLSDLESLELRDNPIRKLPQEIFKDLQSLTHIYFGEFRLCSYALHVRVCEPRGDGISSVQHLLDNIVLRISVWVVALIACFGNLFVLIGRMLIQETNEVHSFFIKNLALADLLMGIYLFIIAYFDAFFRGNFIRHEDIWRHSWQCNFSGFLSTLSSESSVFILTVITTDRYLSVMHPLSQIKRTKAFAFGCMILIWSVAIVLAVIPFLAFNFFGDEFYGSNGVCLALHIHEPFSRAWEYSAFLFCGLNSAAFIYITYAYVNMSITIASSRLGLRTTQQQQDSNITKRFGFIVATDGLCWMPIVIIKTLALAGVPINDDLYAWVAVFLLPVNSALNPIFYTLTTKLFKQNFAKIITYSLRSSSPGIENNSSSSFSSVIMPIRSSGKRLKQITFNEKLQKDNSVKLKPVLREKSSLFKSQAKRQNAV